MSTKEIELKQLKEKLKNEKYWYNSWGKLKLSQISGCMRWEIAQNIKIIEKRIKELEENKGKRR